MPREMPEWKTEARNRFLGIYKKFQDDTNKSDNKIHEETGVSLSTIRDTILNGNFNADFVIAFCRTYRDADINTDLNYIFTGVSDDAVTSLVDESGDNLDSEIKKTYTTFRHSRDCHPLKDEAFMGTFYGYCRNTQYNNIIDDFVLTIEKTPKKFMSATLSLNSHNQRNEATKKLLYGKPMHLEPNIIYIVFQSDAGDDMFIMSYNWFKLNAGKRLYCRYGALMTPCRATNRYPQMQPFIMLDKPVLAENMNYVDGFLNLTQDKIIVPARVFDSETDGLKVKNENVKAFFDKCRDVQYNNDNYYCFSEKVLLALGEANGVDYDTIGATIMTLKENSINPKAVNFPDNKTYSKFFVGLTENKVEK